MSEPCQVLSECTLTLQVVYLKMGQNQLVGDFPESWSSMSNVSYRLQTVQSGANICSTILMVLPKLQMLTVL